jgi:hypothetical protein
MVLGIRYPKTFELAEAPNPNVAVGSRVTWMRFDTVASSAYAYANNGSMTIPIATQRYSNVRKVVFWANVRWSSITSGAKLRVGIRPVTAGTKIAFPLTINPGDMVRLFGGGSVLPVATFDPGDLFDKSGPTTQNDLPIGDDLIEDAGTLVKIEFDRFQGDSADFFQVWDASIDSNTYLLFYLVLERTDGGTFVGGGAFAGSASNIGVTIVQAPGANNKSCTLVPMWPGLLMNGTMSATYDTRAAFFRYNSAEWDNITSITALCVGYQYSGVGTFLIDWDFAFSRVTTLEPAGLTQVYTQSKSIPLASPGILFWYRSEELLSYLQDGELFTFQWQDPASVSESTNFHMGWLEIIQEGFTNTVCYHPAGSPQINGFNHTGHYGSVATGFFDPTWYQSFPDELILDQKIYLSFLHLNNVIDTNVGVFIDADNESNVADLTSSSSTIAVLAPTLPASPSINTGFKNLWFSGFSPNPINLAGTRRLVWGLNTPTSTTEDFAGDGGLYYVLAVPDSEIPQAGNVFPVGSFNPEGCASTAAGLGDPGVLVIANGSLPPKKFNPLAGTIEDAGVPPPFCNEALPNAIVDDTAASPNGGLQPGTYRYRYTFRNCCTGKESDPNGEDIVVDTSGASPAAQVTLDFTNIRIPGDPQICEICVYRTIVEGVFPIMAKVGCFDPDVQSTFVDTVSDEALDFENDPLSTLNAPPPCTPIVVEFRNRLSYMGDIPNVAPAGTVSAVQGSDIITGSFDVEWDRCLEGKYIQLEGDCRPYEILCIMPPEIGTSPPIQRLQLVEPYEGTDQTGATYTICGHPNRIWFSEPFEPEYVPGSSFIDVEPGDGDRIMGAVSNFDSLVVCKRRKTYVLRWRDNPVLEIPCPARVSSDIGCISPRSFAQVESGSVWLSDRGLAIYDGRSVSMVPESSDFDVFFTDPTNPNYVRRDSLGRVLGAVGVYYPKRKQYLLLLPTVATTRGANMLMVWDTHLRNITVHFFCQEFLSLAVGKDTDGNERVYAGDANGFVWILDAGDADGVGTPGQTGTVTGTITAAGIDPALGAGYIEDSTATFISGGLPGLAGLSGVAGLSAAFSGDDLGLAGVCVFFRRSDADPDDPWTSRFVYAATPTRLFVTPPLPTGEDLVGYDYMVGPIDFRAEFKPTSYGDDDVLKRDWRQIVVHNPEDVSSVIRVELRPDFQLSDDEEGTIVNEAGETGEGRTFDMNFSRGRQVRPVGRRIFNFEQVIITNFAPNSPVRLLNHILATAAHTSK